MLNLGDDRGSGSDELWGGAGADKFRTAYWLTGHDVVKDFNLSEGDKIIVSRGGAVSDLVSADLRLIHENGNALLQQTNQGTNQTRLTLENISAEDFTLLRDTSNFDTYFEVI